MRDNMSFAHLSLTPTELHYIITSEKQRNYRLIDLREKHLYEHYHLKGAINIDYDTFMKQGSYETVVRNTAAVILYCERGGSSVYAAKRLADYCRERDMDCRIYSLSGGMTGYQRNFGKP